MADESAKPGAPPPVGRDAATSSQTSPSQSSPGQSSGPTINIADEFGTAKRNLPPAKVVGIAIAAVVVVVAIVAFLTRAKPQAAGSLDSVNAVSVPGQTTTLVVFTFTLHNTAEKSLWVHNIDGKLKTSAGEMSSEAVSAIDFDRYFQAFPALKANAQTPLVPEDKLSPGQSVTRSVMMAFPVSLDAFNQRQSISVVIQPYDQPVPVVLSK